VGRSAAFGALRIILEQTGQAILAITASAPNGRASTSPDGVGVFGASGNALTPTRGRTCESRAQTLASIPRIYEDKGSAS